MSSCGESISSMSIRGAATITSPAVRSAMRITPSSITRESAPMMSLSSASARVSISSSRESGPGWMNSATFCRNVRRSSFSRAGWGSDTALLQECGSGGTTRIAESGGGALRHAGALSAARLVASGADALAGLLHRGQEIPEALDLLLELVVGAREALHDQLAHPRVQGRRRQPQVRFGLAAE